MTMENGSERDSQIPEKFVIPRNITIKQFTEKYLPLDILERKLLDYFGRNKDGEGGEAAKRIVLEMESADDAPLLRFLEENNLLKDELLSDLSVKFEDR